MRKRPAVLGQAVSEGHNKLKTAPLLNRRPAKSKNSAAPRDRLRCAECRRSLQAAEPVWRTRIMTGFAFGIRFFSVLPICSECASHPRFARFREWSPPQACESCGRPVHQPLDRRRHGRTFCCDACGRTAFAAGARQRRAEARSPRPCPSCGETFEPARANARFCSGACRQLAYRKRLAVTDEERDNESHSRSVTLCEVAP